ISKFAEVCYRPGSDIKQVALGIDARGGKLFEDLFLRLDELTAERLEYKILFLDASDEALVKRYKETRHSHPLAKDDRVITGIEKERDLLAEVKQRADHIVDTSNLLARQLKEVISEIFVNNKDFNSLMITVLSFGYKYGIPDDSDLVFDVRFIPNPFYERELKELCGLDPSVKEFVLKWESARIYHEKCLDLITYLIPHYINEGKNQLVIGVGCTGGKHRSVVLAEELYHALQNLGFTAVITHRDYEKDAKRI
ncbi:MAG: RNase adapter RapZ, partial [Clostridiales bacterium]|nr:RNase adapter RapZ [Clostridiales bacterium]